MNHPIVPTDSENRIVNVGQAANAAAARHVFDDYRSRKAANTLRAHDDDLLLFGRFLHGIGIEVLKDFATQPEAWQGITWGLVTGFRNWMLKNEYAIGSVNRALSTVKRYATLAFTAGMMDGETHALIRTVQGYSSKERPKIDEKRTEDGLNTRKMHKGKARKKAEYIVLDEDQLEALKTRYPDNAQGRMLCLMMCLFVDHGLRCSEISLLQVGNVDRKKWTIDFYRQKTGGWEKHRLERDTRQAMKAYMDSGDAPSVGYLFRKTRKNGKLAEPGLSTRSITEWVNKLGRSLAGIPNLSAHDGRHTWATRASEHGTDTLALMQAGGWSSPDMPARYVKKAKITNEGIKLE